jgi:putrescine---pyruvate transaminase
VLDEVVCGFGRLGQWWGATHFGVRPDLVTFAKGVTSGYLPMGGVLVGPALRAPLEADAEFVLRTGYTFSGHPVTAAAALANLDVLARDALAGRAQDIARHLGGGLQALVDGDAVVGARGMMGIWALELGGGIDATEVRDALMAKGVIARPLGSSTVAFCPPLVIADEQMHACVERAGEAVAEVAARR